MNKLIDMFYDVLDFFKYDVLGYSLPEPGNFSVDKFKTKFRFYKEKNGMWLESTEYPGLIASGDTYDELREATFDSILTYFDVPRIYARKLRDNLVLNFPKGKLVKPKSPSLNLEIAVAV